MENKPPADELITLAEAARRYGCVHAYLRQLAIRGRLKAWKLGRDWITTPADVEAFIASRHTSGSYRDDIGIDKTTLK